MRIGMRTVKTAVGAAISIMLAEWLGLEYAVSAGIITILSIQNTKKGSLALAVQRIYSAVLALSIAALFFLVIGFNALSFGLYLLVFIPCAVKLRVTDGIVVSSVLVTHVLVEQSLSFYWFKNEMLLLAIGAGVGILLNLYMPKLEDKLRVEQMRIEQLMRDILLEMAASLRCQEGFQDQTGRLDALRTALNTMQDKAARNLENYFFHSAHYYVQYADMRMVQYRILKQMERHLLGAGGTNEQSLALAVITEKTASKLAEDYPASELVEEVTQMVRSFRKSGLPETRAEFESRAILFQFMNDLRYLLETKRDFYLEFGLERAKDTDARHV
ncbi:aromatic acid exporter family protein [Listeria ilorinensis]|uniref:aromatic acid exporter family protein n=1 Tax=Listeria ilorinensis TaxID=2867439 RepID=UPI001EF573C2|nr:aromatic acid exporter family protein [Listeria ilorinensis]